VALRHDVTVIGSRGGFEERFVGWAKAPAEPLRQSSAAMAPPTFGGGQYADANVGAALRAFAHSHWPFPINLAFTMPGPASV
jgi:hypothetical protein